MKTIQSERVLSGGSAQRLVDMNVHQFFDRELVLRAIGKRKAKALSRIGAEIRRRARASMKLAPQGVAAPAGQPPHRHRKTKKNPSGGGLWRSILFAYDPTTGSVVVGPSTVYGENIRAVAGRHEHGARARTKNPRRRRRKLGQGGEVRIGPPAAATTARVTDFRGEKRLVTYAKLRNQEMVDRANRLNEELYGPETLSADYPDRPFMGPALEKTRPEIPSMLALTWAESLT